MRDGYRIERKYLIGPDTAASLRTRLAPFMQPDSRAVDGTYRIRSLYFDSPDADAFWEKTDGEEERSKYRLRFYNGDPSFIRLERKEKKGDLTRKVQAVVREADARAMQRGDFAFLANAGDPLCRAFYAEVKAKRLLPAVTVEYCRTPLVYAQDNVRITIDTEVYVGNAAAFFSRMRAPFPVLDCGCAILEVKTDDRLPVVLGRVLESVPRQHRSFSKYALGFARLNGIE